MAKKLIQVVYKVDNKELTKTQSQIRGLEQDTKKAETGFQKVGKAGSTAFAAIGGAIAALGLIQLGKQIIQITGEFQKFQAVLTNTLGSRSAANAAMKQIQKFAAETPFSVQELTSSFVKLANQGFKPTQVEMRKLGDLASAMGKSFDQLTEAIIDSQTGEFERLKEFGIRAAKEGDKVTFTFKEVKTQVDFTASSIRDYILSLGDLEGVSGGMAAISLTLTGRLSNLGDAYDALLTKLGNSNSGIIFESIELLSKMMNVLNVSMSDPISDKAADNAETFRDALEAAFKTGDPEKINKAIQDNVKETNSWAESVSWLTREVAKASEEDFPKLNNQLQVEQATLKLLSELTQEYITKAKALSNPIKTITDDTEKLTEAQKKLLDQINDRGKGKFPLELDAYVRTVVSLTKNVNDKVKGILDKGPSPIVGVLTGGKDTIEISDELDTILDMSLGFLDDIFQATINNQQKIFEAESFDYDRKLLLAGDNERARQELAVQKEDFDKEQAKKKEAFDKEQDNRNKQAAIKKMSLDLIVGTLKAFLTPPIPNIVLATTVGAFGLAQIGAAKAIGFKDGVIDLQGPGTGTSDSIPSMLSKGESVMTADETVRSRNLLTAIREKKIDDRILEKAGTAQMIVASLNDQRIVQAIRESRQPSLAREGYTLMETHHKGSNLRIKQRAKLGL